MDESWLWDSKRSEKEVKEILRNPKSDAFLHYAVQLFSRSNEPEEIFSHYIRKEDFCVQWQKIKRRMLKNKWNSDRVKFWDYIYRYLMRDYRKKGIKIKKEFIQPRKESLSQQVGATIKHLREMSGLTQKELAEKANMKQQAISRIESGTANPSVGTLERISRYLKGKVSFSIIEFPSYHISGSISESGSSSAS